MHPRALLSKWSARFQRVDWVLLGLMTGITQNRFFSVKLLAILAAVVLTPAVRTLRRSGLHWFYLALAGWTAIQYLFITRNYAAGYSLVALYAFAGWVCMALVAATLLAVNDRNPQRSRATLEAYFWVVAVLSGVSLLSTVIGAGTWNPYEQAPEPIYGMSSGDHVTGLYGFHLFSQAIGDFSNLNAAVLSLFIVWFFYDRAWGKAALALFLMLATSSNTTTLLTLLLLAAVVAGTRQRSYLLAGLAALGFTLAFYAAITPKNLRYAVGQISSKLHLGNDPSPQRPARPHTAGSRRPDRGPEQQAAPAPAFDPTRQSGKLQAFRQTKAYLLQDPGHFLAGAGAGRFSSWLALLAADPSPSKGGVFRPLRYQSRTYRNGHGKIIQTITNLPPQYHTVSQLPYSWYNQIWGEYGFVGACLFALLYVGWCVRRGWNGVGKYLLLAILLLLVAEYFFENFCLVPVFEWLFLLHWSRSRPGRPEQPLARSHA